MFYAHGAVRCTHHTLHCYFKTVSTLLVLVDRSPLPILQNGVMITIDQIKQAVRNEAYRYSRHGDQERQNDNLSLSQVAQALLNGRILEHYADTGRGASCLVAGFADNGIPIHAVCGCMGKTLVIITVYIPAPPKFKNPFERGNP